MTEDQIKSITISLKESIKNINRILQKWIYEANLKNSHLKFSIVDIKGLVKGEMLRTFRNNNLSKEFNMILRRVHLSVDVDCVNGNIRSINLGTLEEYNTYYHICEHIKKILQTLPYKDLHYNERDYEFIGDIQVPLDRTFNPTFDISFKSLDAIIF